MLFVFPQVKIEEKKNSTGTKPMKLFRCQQGDGKQDCLDESTVRKLCHSGAQADEDELTLKDDEPGEMGHHGKNCSLRDTDNKKSETM